MRPDAAFRRLPVAALLALTLLAAGCGGGSGKAIKIAYISNCKGPLSFGYEASVAGVELPLINRGATLRESKPSDGVASVSIGGKRIELLLGCESYGNFKTTLAELRRLVEGEGAEIVVFGGNQGDGLVLKQYATRQPGVTFATQTGEQSTTLRNPARNLFRFSLDAAQWSAGLGTYAYRTLGWRNAVTVGEDDPAGWPQVAGFVAEFCSLGGHVLERLWPPDLKNSQELVDRIPARVDGVVVPSALQDVEGFIAAWARRHADVGRSLLVGAVPLSGPLTAEMLGLVGSSGGPWAPTAASRRYSAAFAGAFPGLQGGFNGYFASQSYNEMEPVLEALEQVDGDLSHGERRLQRALARLTFDAPSGVVHLDGRRQAIAPVYLGRVERDAGGKLFVRQIRVVPDVEQTFGGYFGPTSPPPSRTQPACERGHQPSWAR